MVKLTLILCLFLPALFAQQNRLEDHIVFSQTEENLIGYLHLEKDLSIDQSTYIQMKFATEDFKKKGVRFIILHLDTPGGEVLASIKIAELLQKVDLIDGIPVIAFIDNWAISAGAILAYSCRYIGVVKSSIMGAAEPVFMGNKGEIEPASEKINSALRAQMASLASYYQRDPLIAKAMVSKDIILVRRNHQIIELEDDKEIKKTDLVISKKGQLLTLNFQEILDYGVADFMVPIKATEPISSRELKEGQWPFEKSLLAQNPFLSSIPHASVLIYKNWKITFFSILSNPVIASILMMGLMIGFYVEMSGSGFGVAGSIALACLALIILNSFAIYTIGVLESIILSMGIGLVLIEFFLIPGFGFTGILGIFLMIIGMFVLLLPGIGVIDFFNMDTFQLVEGSVRQRLEYLLGALILSIIIIVLLARFVLPKIYLYTKIVLTGEQESKDGYVSGPRNLPKAGAKGNAYTELRPFGKITIDGLLYEATTERNFIEKNSSVVVLSVEGNKVVVRKVL